MLRRWSFIIHHPIFKLETHCVISIRKIRGSRQPVALEACLSLSAQVWCLSQKLCTFNDCVYIMSILCSLHSGCRCSSAVTTWGTWTWTRSTTSCRSWWRGKRTLRWHHWSPTATHTSCGSNTATFTVSVCVFLFKCHNPPISHICREISEYKT